ncbi:MAG: LPS-assembly protein LptD, partial [Pseudomonadota bacterium]
MRRLLCALLCAIWPIAAGAQSTGPTALLADELRVFGSTLDARGNVTLWVNGQQLDAERVIFDRATNSLQIQGPIRLQDGAGTVILADQADLDLDTQAAVLRDARLILEQRLQMAAVEIARPNARYTGLFKVAMTSCYVCAGGTPIWQIRAR